MRRPRPSRQHGLERILSKAGVCSRAEARRWIEDGRVRVNGVPIFDPDAWFDPARDAVTVDGKRLRAAEKLYYALHKPRGYLTTRTDPGGRPTVYDLFDELDAWLIPVGRLDLETSGLLLLTNDTQFAERVTNPESHVEKTYRVEARPRLDAAALERLRQGVVLHDGPTRPARVENVKERGPATIFELSISEGRNRQVRRMVKEVGSRVEKLARLSIGPVELGGLAPGAVRPLSEREARALGA
jgi:23S rRNA pseudouridine2605 synthase